MLLRALAAVKNACSPIAPRRRGQRVAASAGSVCYAPARMSPEKAPVGPAPGTLAPPFRLPSAQGPDIALEDYRGRGNLIVWFTKGLACPFCRRQMTQLAQIYPQIHGLETEILEITPTVPERARFYARRFPLPFPYLCDPEHAVATAWGLGVRPHSATKFLRRLDPPPGSTVFDAAAPSPGEWDQLLLDDDTGFFVLDKTGTVRSANAGSYYSSAWKIPPNDAILGELRRLAS